MQVTISNETSPHFGKKGKLIEEIKDENLVLIYIKTDEMLYQFKPSEFTTNSNKKIQTPKSRKDFYLLITKKETTKHDIKNIIEDLERKNLFNFREKEDKQDQNGISKEVFFDFILDPIHTKSEIISHIRELRDQGYIEFSLPNNSFNTRPIEKKNKHHKKKTTKKTNKKIEEIV